MLLEPARSLGDDLVHTETAGVFNHAYVLGRRLGFGCSASVFRLKPALADDAAASDDAKGATALACKLAVRKPRINWPLVLSVFRSELALLRACAHPHVLECHGLYEGRNEVALVLQYVSAGDIQQLLQRHGALSEQTVVAIVSQLCDALSHVHALGILHRDVKPENALVEMVGDAPYVRLCDFGHSCYASELHHQPHFYGTPGYAAPEVNESWRGGPLWSVAADIWSLGTVAYVMLRNRPLSVVDGLPDMSGSAFGRVSFRMKQLLRELLRPVPEQRASLEHLGRTLAAAAEPTAAGATLPLRRAAMAAAGLSADKRAYSLLNLSSLDSELKPQLAAEPSGWRTHTNGSNFEGSSRGSTGSLRGLVEVAGSRQSSGNTPIPNRRARGCSDSAAAACPRSGVEVAASQSASAEPQQRIRVLTRAANRWTSLFQSTRSLMLELTARGILLVNVASGDVDLELPFGRLVAISDASAARRDDDAMCDFSLLIEAPLCCGFFVRQLHFRVADASQCSELVQRIRAALACADNQPTRQQNHGALGVSGASQLCTATPSDASSATTVAATAAIPPAAPAVGGRGNSRSMAVSSSCSALDVLGGGGVGLRGSTGALHGDEGLSGAQREQLRHIRASMAQLRERSRTVGS